MTISIEPTSVSLESHSQWAWAPTAAIMVREVLNFMMTGLDRCASHGQEAAQQESIEGASRSGLYTTLLTTKTTTGVVHAAATVALIVIP